MSNHFVLFIVTIAAPERHFLFLSSLFDDKFSSIDCNITTISNIDKVCVTTLRNVARRGSIII